MSSRSHTEGIVASLGTRIFGSSALRSFCRIPRMVRNRRKERTYETIPRTVFGIVSYVRSFLRFLTMRGILQKDLSAELPKIRVPRDATIPSVWDHELIVRLLGAVDRSSAKGRRDYAILLLACR